MVAAPAVALVACVTTSEQALVAAADRVVWPFHETDFTLEDPVTGEPLGSVQVSLDAEATGYRATPRDAAGAPYFDLPEPIPFVLAALPADAVAEAGHARPWLVEWGGGSAGSEVPTAAGHAALWPRPAGDRPRR